MATHSSTLAWKVPWMVEGALFHHNGFMSMTTHPTTGGARRTNPVMCDQKVETFRIPPPDFWGKERGLRLNQ